MAVSGSSDFTRTRDQIIARALRICGAVKAGETIDAQEVTDAAEALNAMVKRWSATPGMHVWCTSEATLFPQASQVRYGLSTSSTDHATESYAATELTAAASSGATSITVDSITGISNGDNIGVVVDDGTIHWTTVSGAPSGSTVILTTGLDAAAASGNAVFAYTTKIVRPLKVVDARVYSIANATEIPLTDPLARRDYQALPNKAQTGTINQVFYDPQRDTGYLYLWNPPATVTDLVKLTWHRPIMDFDAAANNPDLPQEWIDVLVWGLADLMCPEYDVPADKAGMIAGRAAKYLDDVAGFDREAESIEFGAEMER